MKEDEEEKRKEEEANWTRGGEEPRKMNNGKKN